MDNRAFDPVHLLMYTVSMKDGSLVPGFSGKGVIDGHFEVPSGDIEFFIRFISNNDSIAGAGATIEGIIIE